MSTLRMPNPSKAGDNLQAKQSYEIGPDGEHHHYEAALARWTPTSLGFDVHLVNTGPCGGVGTYLLTVVDEGGVEHPLHAISVPVVGTSRGTLGNQITDVRFAAQADVIVTPSTPYVVLRMRPRQGSECSSVDLRFDFQ